jgi:flagellin
MPGPANSIHTSLSGMVAQRSLARSQEIISKAMERLSTGKRINRASDDPSGLMAADKLGNHRVALEDVIKQSELAGALPDTADGALGVVQDLLLDLGGTVVRAANTGGQEQGEREALQIEANSIIFAIDRIVNTTSFKGKRILAEGDGVMINGAWVGVNKLDAMKLGWVSESPPPPPAPGPPEGAKEEGKEAEPPRQPRSFHLEDMIGGGGLNLVDGDLELAQLSVEGAIKSIAGMRASIGSMQKYTLGHSVDALRVEAENTAAAESKIRDADFAQEAANLVRGQVMQQASIFALQKAQEQNWRALHLLG